MQTDTNEVLSHLGKRLSERRLAMGIRREPLASILGISKSAYDRWEQGKTNPSGMQLLALLSILDLSVRDCLPLNDTDVVELRTLVKGGRTAF